MSYVAKIGLTQWENSDEWEKLINTELGVFKSEVQDEACEKVVSAFVDFYKKIEQYTDVPPIWHFHVYASNGCNKYADISACVRIINQYTDSEDEAQELFAKNTKLWFSLGVDWMDSGVVN